MNSDLRAVQRRIGIIMGRQDRTENWKIKLKEAKRLKSLEIMFIYMSPKR